MPDTYRKTTLNLWAYDVREMERLYGRGWSEKVRDLVHEHLKSKQTHKIDFRREDA